MPKFYNSSLKQKTQFAMVIFFWLMLNVCSNFPNMEMLYWILCFPLPHWPEKKGRATYSWCHFIRRCFTDEIFLSLNPINDKLPFMNLQSEDSPTVGFYQSRYTKRINKQIYLVNKELRSHLHILLCPLALKFMSQLKSEKLGCEHQRPRGL